MSALADELNINMRSVYPGAGGETAGVEANTTTEIASQPNVKNSAPATVNPLLWWGVLVALFVGLMFLGQKTGGVEGFSNIKMTFYNIVIITLCAVIGLSLCKALALRWNINGLSQLILAA